MAKTKTRYIKIIPDKGVFSVFFEKFKGEKKDYDFSGVSALRKLLSNEKARILSIIKKKNPSSIYDLAKTLGRNFKSVRDDVQLLERFGFLELVAEKKGNRERLKPVIAIDSMKIEFFV